MCVYIYIYIYMYVWSPTVHPFLICFTASRWKLGTINTWSEKILQTFQENPQYTWICWTILSKNNTFGSLKHPFPIYWGYLGVPPFLDRPNLPSGKRVHRNGLNHHFSWDNSLLQWLFSIAMWQITRGNLNTVSIFLLYSHEIPINSI